MSTCVATSEIMLLYRVIRTKTGPFLLMQDEAGVIRTGWSDLETTLPAHARQSNTLLPDLAARLTGYFGGDAVDFSDVELPPGPPFHAACWKVARAIPRGSTSTYARLARAAGSPLAVRAAGQAMRKNPIPVIVPCHRVLATGGGIGGFAGTRGRESLALRTKNALLAMEDALID